MIGQWCGNYGGTNNGYAILNIEEHKGLLHGSLYLHENLTGTPGLLCWIFLDKELKVQLINQNQLYPINPVTFLAEENRESFLSEYVRYNPSYLFPDNLNIQLKFTDGELHLDIKSNIGNDISARLENKTVASGSKVNLPSGWPTSRTSPAFNVVLAN